MNSTRDLVRCKTILLTHVLSQGHACIKLAGVLSPLLLISHHVFLHVFTMFDNIGLLDWLILQSMATLPTSYRDNMDLSPSASWGIESRVNQVNSAVANLNLCKLQQDAI